MLCNFFTKPYINSKQGHLPDYISGVPIKTSPSGDTPSFDTGSAQRKLPETALAPEKTISPQIREREHIIELLRQEKGHVGSVALRLNMPASTLYRKLKKYNINAKDYKVWY